MSASETHPARTRTGSGSASSRTNAFIPGWVGRRDEAAACALAEQALEQLAITWYATGMDRVLEVRKALQPWNDLDSVQALDDRLYGWQATLSTLQP